MRTYIYPYKMASESARLLAQSLGAIRLRVIGTYTPRSEDFIVNWGNGLTPAFFDRVGHLNASGGHVRFLNVPSAVHNAANKLLTFNILNAAGVAIPDYTTHVQTVAGWMREGHSVYCRSRLTGHSGQGITVEDERNNFLTNAPLYVKKVDNHGEYRVHVVNGQIIAYCKKRRRNGDAPTDQQNDIRNLGNGWIYTRQNLRHLERVEQLAIRAVAALGLDFGAVDIIKNEAGDVFVLEVNTACGMSDSTLNDYITVFRNMMNNA